MNDDYYSHAPRLVLSRPVVVTALDIRPARNLVHQVGSQLGLNLQHHADRVQHLAGRSYVDLIGEPETLADYETRALEALLTDRPCGLISLTGRLVRPELSERADVVLLVHQPLAPPHALDAAVMMGVGLDVPAVISALAQLPVHRIAARPERAAIASLTEYLGELATP